MMFDDGFAGDPKAILLNGIIVFFIVASVVAVILETHRPLWTQYELAFWAFESLSVAVFSVEYLARVWASVENPAYAHLTPTRARLRYIFSPLAIIDLIAVLPFYLALIWPVDLRYLRMLRLLRLFKLSHYFSGVNLFLRVLRTELPSLGAALFVVLVLIVLSSILMFYLESAAQPQVFRSIADAIWWSVVTLTTVGYGDVTPATFGGRLLAIVIMLMGIATVAIPAGLLAARFTEELHRRRRELEDEVREALADGLIDEEEREALETLCDELGLPDDAVQRIVEHQRHVRRHRRECPACGHDLTA